MTEAERLRSILQDVEGERIALVDAFRFYLESQGVDRTTAALYVQRVIDNAKPYRRHA